MRFVFLGPVFCLQLPSDSTSPWTPLLLANLYFCLRGSGLTPYSSCACRAHSKKPLFVVTNSGKVLIFFLNGIVSLVDVSQVFWQFVKYCRYAALGHGEYNTPLPRAYIHQADVNPVFRGM